MKLSNLCHKNSVVIRTVIDIFINKITKLDPLRNFNRKLIEFCINKHLYVILTDTFLVKSNYQVLMSESD